MRLEVLGSRLITADFHYPQLVPLPYCVCVSEVSGGVETSIPYCPDS